MIIVGARGIVLGVVVGMSSLAAADEVATVDRIWPSLPEWHGLSLEDQITDHLSDAGNRIGEHLDVLSHDMLALHVDGRGNRARLRLGGGDVRYLKFRIDSDWHFVDGQAHVRAHLELGLAGHVMDVKLPEMDVIPDSWHGQQLVEINVPLLERKF